MDPESVAVTAGLGGFLSFFLLAVALYFLMRNMNARMRRMAYRQEQEATAAEGGARTDGSTEGGTEGGIGGLDSLRPKDGPSEGPDVR